MRLPPLWLDVTDALASGRRTGIQRVTIELAKEVLHHRRGGLIRLDPAKRSFVALSSGEITHLFQGPPGRRPRGPWRDWVHLGGLTPFLGWFRDWVRAVRLIRGWNDTFGWDGGVYLTAEIVSDVARFGALAHLAGRGIPTVLMLHDLFPLTNPEYRSLRPGAFKRHWALSVRSAKLIAVSEYTRNEALAWARLRHQSLPPIAVVHPGSTVCDTEQVPDAGIPKRFLLCVGTIELRKNQRRLLETFLRYRRCGGKAGLVLVGRLGLGEVFLGKQIQKAAHEQVTWLEGASDEELAWLYRRAQSVVYPSLAEGFGLPIIEALAHGTPCITSSRTGTAEVADAYGGCITVDPEDEESLLRAMLQSDDDHHRAVLAGSIDRSRLPSWGTFFTQVDEICRN